MTTATNMKVGDYVGHSYSIDNTYKAGDVHATGHVYDVIIRVRPDGSIVLEWLEDNVECVATLKSEDGEIFRGAWSVSPNNKLKIPKTKENSGLAVFNVYQRRNHIDIVGRYGYGSNNPSTGFFWAIVGNIAT
jgi:hypothetical protein